MSELKPSPEAVQTAAEQGREQVRLRSLTPTWDDVRAELKSGVVIRELPNGQTEAHIDFKTEDAEQRRKVFHGMFEKRRLAETEMGAARSAAIPATVLTDRDGNTRTVPSAQAEKVARRKGLYEKPYYGRPSKRFVGGKWYIRKGSDWYEEGEA